MMQPAKGSRSINQIAMSVILASISIGLLSLVPMIPFPMPGAIILLFIGIFVVSLVTIIAKKFWGYLLGTIAFIVLFALFVPNISASLTRPSSNMPSFALAMIAVIGLVLSIPFGIQGFRESRGKISVNPFQASKLTILALLGFGIFAGGMITANLGALSQGSSTVSLSGPPDTTLTLEEKNSNFATKELTVKGGNVLILVKNSDGTVHTFTIDEIGVNVENPASRTSLAAFNADKPGTYSFYCAIPGHREGGMEGKITVQV